MVFEKIRDYLVETIGCKPEDVTFESKFLDDLGCDSLDIIELIMAMEEEFNIDIPDNDVFGTITTVGEAVEYIQTHM